MTERNSEKGENFKTKTYDWKRDIDCIKFPNNINSSPNSQVMRRKISWDVFLLNFQSQYWFMVRFPMKARNVKSEKKSKNFSSSYLMLWHSK